MESFDKHILEFFYLCIITYHLKCHQFDMFLSFQDYSVSSIKMRDSDIGKRNQHALVRPENEEKVTKSNKSF